MIRNTIGSFSGLLSLTSQKTKLMSYIFCVVRTLEKIETPKAQGFKTSVLGVQYL